MPRSNEVRLYIGKKGSGKTTQVRRVLVEAPRRFIIDPMHEYVEGVIIDHFDALVAYVGPMVNAPRYSVVFRTMDDAERDAVIALPVTGSPEDPPLPGLTLVVDEVDRICTPYLIPDGLRRVVNYGRHFGVSVIAACRRPRAMHRDLTANADRIIIGQTQEPGDLDYLREFIGEDLAERAARLGPWQFVTWPDDLNKRGDHAEDSSARPPARRDGAPMGVGAEHGPGSDGPPRRSDGDGADDAGGNVADGAAAPGALDA